MYVSRVMYLHNGILNCNRTFLSLHQISNLHSCLGKEWCTQAVIYPDRICCVHTHCAHSQPMVATRMQHLYNSPF